LAIAAVLGDKVVLNVIERTGGPEFAKEACIVITNIEAFKPVPKGD
jgi:hypothetical protein